MCDRDASAIARAIEESLAATSSGLTTESLLSKLSAQGICGLHVRLALRAQLKNGTLSVSRATGKGEPQTDSSAVWLATASKKPGRIVRLPGDFEKHVDQVLGRGGMSVVYAGRQPQLNRPVAIKTLHGSNVKSDAEGQLLAERMKREAKALAALNHPNIVNVLHAAVDKDGHPFIVMEKIEGKTLDDVIQHERPLDILRTVWVAIEIVRALRYAYSKAGVLHRDIKPSNIMLTPEGVKVMDFGLAKWAAPDESVFSDTTRLPVDQDDLTRPGAFLGTFLTQAPEVYTGSSNVRSDIYAFGATLYYLISGGSWCFNHPVANDAIGLWVNAHLNVDKEIVDIRDPSRRPDTPQVLARIVHTCLKREPGERYQSWDLLLEDLDRARRHLEPKTTCSRIPVPPQGSSAGDAGLTTFLSRIDEAHRGVSSTTQKVLGQTAPGTGPLPPTLSYLAALVARARAAEEILRTQYGPDALSQPGPVAATVAQLSRLPSNGTTPVCEIFRKLLEAETGVALEDFDSLYAAVASGDEVVTKNAPCHIAVDPTWYFYLAESMARHEDEQGANSFSAQAAAAIVTFLEYLCGSPELAPHRIDIPQPENSQSGAATGPASTSSSGRAPAASSPSTITMAAGDASPSDGPPDVEPRPLPAGTKIGDAHVVVRRLGDGGNGEVYLARHAKLNREQAIKMLRPALAGDREFVERFQNEARMAAQLGHPHIVPVHDFFEWGGTWCLVMAYVPGSTLSRYREAKGTLDPREALVLVRQILDALDHAHRAGLVHRDIKPDNILLDQEGKAYLTDFGLVKSSRHEVGPRTTEGVFWGTPEYASPEQARGLSSLDPRTDLYSLGAVLYELLTGHVPFTAATRMALLYKISDENDHPSPPRELVPELDYRIDVLVSRMLAKQPEERYLRARDVIDDIDRILESMDRGEAPAKPPSRALPTMVALIILAVAAFIAWQVWPTDPIPGETDIANTPKKLPTLPPEKSAPPPEAITPDPAPMEPPISAPSLEAAKPIPALPLGTDKPHVEIAAPPVPEPLAAVPPPAPKLTALERLAMHVPTEDELAIVTRAFEIMRETLPARANYSFQEALAQLLALKKTQRVTPWSETILDAEIERLDAGMKAFAKRPLFEPKKKAVLLLRDGRTLQGTIHSESGDQVVLALPNELREPVPLALVLPTSLPQSSPERQGTFAPRAAAGGAAGVLPEAAHLPDDLLARHLPGLVSSAIDESRFAATTRGDFRLLATLEIPAELRKALGLILGDRLKAFDAEQAAAKLYLKRKDPKAFNTLLSQHRETLAGERAASDILQSFLQSLPDTAVPEIRDKFELVLPGADWVDDPGGTPPESEAIYDPKAKAYFLKSPPHKESRIFRASPGSGEGFQVRYRLSPLSDLRGTLLQIGSSRDRWLRIQGGAALLVQQVAKPQGEEVVIRLERQLSAPLKRATVTVVPRPELSLNLWYLDSRLIWALPDGKDGYPIDGIVISVFGGEVFIESVRVKNPN